MYVTLLHQLSFDFHGELILRRNGQPLKYVGVGHASSRRRDFVRVQAPPENNTCLSAQILAFVRISGFSSHGVLQLPEHLRTPENSRSVVFGLIRWLTPHEDVILRDDDLRPVCPPPLARYEPCTMALLQNTKE